MSRPITTSLSIDFSTDLENGVLQMEVDGRKEGINGGVTDFYAGDSPGFLLYKTSYVTDLELYTTEGGINYEGGGSVLVEEFLLCRKESVIRFPKPMGHGFSIVKSWGEALNVRKITEEGLLLGNKPLAVIKVEYYAPFSAYRLTGASGEAPVIIFATGIVQTGEDI